MKLNRTGTADGGYIKTGVKKAGRHYAGSRYCEQLVHPKDKRL